MRNVDRSPSVLPQPSVTAGEAYRNAFEIQAPPAPQGSVAIDVPPAASVSELRIALPRVGNQRSESSRGCSKPSFCAATSLAMMGGGAYLVYDALKLSKAAGSMDPLENYPYDDKPDFPDPHHALAKLRAGSALLVGGGVIGINTMVCYYMGIYR